MELKQAIIDTAISMFAREGLHFTMQDIAAEMHIAKKTIYTVFPSKESLLCAMLDEGFSSIHADKKKILESDLDLIEKIRRVMIAMPDQYQLIDFRRLNDLREKYPAAHERLIQHLEEDWDPVIRLLETAEEEGLIRNISIPLFRMIFTSSLESFLFTDTLSREKISYQQALQELMDILISGIRKDAYEEDQ